MTLKRLERDEPRSRITADLYLPDRIIDDIDTEAERRGTRRTQLIREAVLEWHAARTQETT